MKHAIAIAVTIFAMTALTGCPGMNPLDKSNTIVLHNDYETLLAVSVVRVPDECSTQKPEGINLLPEPLEVGDTFKVDGLDDGRYYCRASRESDFGLARTGYVTLSGGKMVDWYVTE